MQRSDRFITTPIASWLVAFWAMSPFSWGDDNLIWKQLESIPNPLGLAGPVSGTDGISLIVAGGANYPDAPPWNNGRKVWYDAIYLLESPEGRWKKVGSLNKPIGYAVSVSIPPGLGIEPGVAYLGGSNADGHHADCWILRWKDGKIQLEDLPSLPSACANASGALWEGTMYVAGGIEKPDSTRAMHRFWSLNLRQRPLRWQELAVWPGVERMLAVTTVQDNAFYLCSGVSLSADPGGRPQRTYLRDAYRYQQETGWTRIADLPRPAVAAASPAPPVGQSSFLVLGGDDGRLIDFRPLDQHPGFPKSILAYHATTDTWKSLSRQLPVSPVTTTAVPWHGKFVIPTGEIRPGVRSPQVWSFSE